MEREPDHQDQSFIDDPIEDSYFTNMADVAKPGVERPFQGLQVSEGRLSLSALGRAIMFEPTTLPDDASLEDKFLRGLEGLSS